MSNYVNIFKEEIIPGYITLGNGSENRIGRIGSAVLMWRRRSIQRSALANLDARMLNDIGLSREQAVEEAAKPFWQG